MNRYSQHTIQITKVAMLLALTVLFSYITSVWSPIPRLPILNGRPDFWYGIAFVSLFFINWKYRILFILALPFVLIPSELEYGWISYSIEYIAPMSIMLLTIIPIKNFWKELYWFIFVALIYFMIRLLFHTYAGVIIWNVPWGASFVYNISNVFSDIIVSVPIFVILLIKLNKRIGRIL